MSKFFIHIYEWFERHRITFYVILFLSVAIFALMASQLSFQENITSFFNNDDEKKNATFDNVAVKDKIIVMLSGENPDDIISSAEIFENEINPLVDEGLLSSVMAYADDETVGRTTSFIYDYLPIFLSDADYEALGNKVSPDEIRQNISNVYNLLTSPSGMIIGDVIMKDPLNIGTPLLSKFEQYNPDLQYEIYNGRLFSKDMTTLLMFLQPSNGMGDTGNNDKLVAGLESAENKAEINGVNIDCIGGPIVAVYNARQIKKDTTITLSLAMAFILFVIFMSFRNKRSIPLIIIPPIFGTLFSLAMIWLIQGGISVIAIGAGTVVLGISLSYSIHIVAHLNHISSPKEIIEELTMPLTIGSFTTICAFAALTFTSSMLLRDMGLFAVFTLIGTTVFCLVFMPQFLRNFNSTKKTAMLNKIEQAVGYNYDGNKWVVIPIILIAIVALFFYRDVKFDDNMSNINFMPQHIIDAEARSVEIFGDESQSVYIVTGGENINALAEEYQQLEQILCRYEKDSVVSDIVTIKDFVIPLDIQKERINKWNEFWTEKRDITMSLIDENAQQLGFRKGAFAQFEDIISKNYDVCSYTKEEIASVPLVSEWVSSSDDMTSLLCRISIDEQDKAEVYDEIDKLEHTAVIDRGYFSSKMVESTNNDFNYILLVSSMIVFLALLISYGRLELTLLAFLPMAMSWVIILGMMALLGIKFNIVNIILATFIFGIGDDFSIFIMDGLLQEYKNGKKVLGAHKTAIFFSAFTAIVGMGVLIFAQHPALKSIATISVLGLSVVVLVSYTIQPMLFRWLVTSQTEKGGFPYTIGSILNTLYCFLYFLLGCILSQIYMLILMPLPMKRATKKLAFHKMVYWFTRIFLSTMITVRTVRKNPFNETYEKPAVIIANHQSFIDILLLLSTSPKIVMLTNSWVWNSPFFGWIVKYADFHHTEDGYEVLAERLKERVDEGYSVVVFPEGTRSADCSIQRFHKGAFYLAQLLKVDILPMLIYGAGQISAKKQGFYIKSGIVATKTLKRVEFGDTSFGTTYQEQAKNFRKLYVEQYRIFNDELGRTSNAYFRDALIKNYIYKGPVLEWYMRIKCRIDGYYDLWDRLIPRKATITDIGCGYGQMSFMLGLLSPERTILGIDYDEDKIELANNSFLRKKTNTNFKCADMTTVEIPMSDAILFNDSLHYVNADAQKDILSRAAQSLNEGGMIVVRDGDVSQTDKHEKIKTTEKWSTEIIKFNKTTTDLTFVSAEWMRSFAESNGLEIKIRKCDNDSSETLYILTKTSL